MIQKLSSVFVGLALLFSCTPNSENGQQQPVPFPDLDGTILLGHRGNGNQSDLEENSIPAIDYGMSQLDGVEIDIQMSKDTTLWIFHDFDILNCEKNSVALAELPDNEIAEIIECRQLELVQFDSLIHFLQDRDYGVEKYISLDLKCTQSREVTEKFGGVEVVSQIIHRSIKHLENATDNRFVVLAEVADLSYAESINLSAERTFLLCRDGDGCIDQAQEKSIGLSLSMQNALENQDLITKEKFSHPIQVWTPNSGTELLQVSKLKPDFIQGDQIGLLKACRLMNEQGYKQTNVTSESELTKSGEYITIHKQNGTPKEGDLFVSIFLKIDLENANSEPVLVISTKVENGENRWRSVPLKHGENQVLEHFGSDHKTGDSTHIYLWNSAKDLLQVERLQVDLLGIKEKTPPESSGGANH